MSVRGLADHPVCVAAEGPAGDGTDQGLLVAQTLDEVGDELRQVRYHALHTAWKEKKVICITVVKIKSSPAKHQDIEDFRNVSFATDIDMYAVYCSIHYAVFQWSKSVSCLTFSDSP